MSIPTPRIDHVVIGVKNRLDEAAERYRALGFDLLERGHHTLGTSNHLAIFGDDYLELLGYEPKQADPQAGNPMWRLPIGLIGLVFKPDDVDALGEHLRASGFSVDKPRSFSRPVRLPDGQVAEAHFRTLHLPSETSPNGVVFFCQHGTPEHVWRDEWRNHPNGVTGIREFVVAAADPAASAQPFTRIFGAQALVDISDGLRLSAGSRAVLFLTPDGVQRHFHGLASGLTEGRDRFVGLVLRTRDIDATLSVLRSAAIPGVLELADRVIVPAEQAFGVAITFTDKD